jgi:hypothetical protein
MKTIARLARFTLFLTIAVPSVRHASASQLFVDQQNLPSISAGWSATYLGPIGQEFVPQYSALESIELMLANTDTSSPFPADVELSIREDSILGTVIGTSDPLSLPFGTSGVAHFEFRSTVRLTPGRTYVIEIVTFPGGGNVGVSGGWSGGYPQGRLIVAGEPIPLTDGSDLWFREGTHRRVR